MSTTTTPVPAHEWWQVPEARYGVETCLDKLNESRGEQNVVQKFYCALEGFNALWNTKSRLDGERGRSDNQAFRALLLGIPGSRQEELCRSAAAQELAQFAPQILNQDCLQDSPAYIPGQPLSLELRRHASREHRQLKEAIDGWNAVQNEDTRLLVMQKLASLLYVVRSNIAHGEKTRYGPDLDKALRDRQVCEICLPVVAALVDAIFDYPSRLLVAYGTLRPSEPNHSKLDGIGGQRWSDCEIVGAISESDGLRFFEWRKAAKKNAAKLLRSVNLPHNWAVLDTFEGNRYVRTLSTAEVGGLTLVATVYQKRPTG